MDYPTTNWSYDRRATLGLSLVIVLLGRPLSQGNEPEQAAAKVLAAMQGEWRVTLLERDGEKVELGEDALYTIKGNNWLQGDRPISAIAIDATYTPGLLDLTRLIDDGRKGVKMEGIYRIDGDTMVWCCCTGDAAKQRPQEFKAPAGWDGVMYHMTRVNRSRD